MVTLLHSGAFCNKNAASYIENAIRGELDRLINCPPGSQDVTMYKTACALAGMVKGWELDQAGIRDRFFGACGTLSDAKGKGKRNWTAEDFAKKWRDAMAKAEPRSWPPSSTKLNGGQHHAPKDEPLAPLRLRSAAS